VYVFATIDHAVSPGVLGPRDGGPCQAGAPDRAGRARPGLGGPWSDL